MPSLPLMPCTRAGSNVACPHCGPARPREPSASHVLLIVGGGLAGVVTVLAVIVAFAMYRMTDGHSKVDIAQLQLNKLALEAYPSWRATHAGCPGAIDELFELADTKDGKDPWGSPIVMACNSAGILVVSAGEDLTFGTADDAEAASKI
ncbi:MAG TPA: hypothetical protein VLB44_03175 [Kofleriaceae bacterium]|nr:hypothetical protein [Kofleriaceae bacterium]